MSNNQDFYDTVDRLISLLDKPKIIQNAVEVAGVIYRSTSVHDYVGLPDGRAIDGGHEYLRRVGSFDENEDLSLYSDSPWPEIFEKLTWGTYSIDGRQPLRWVRIKDMSVSHIRNVLKMFNESPKLSKQVTLETCQMFDEIVMRCNGCDWWTDSDYLSENGYCEDCVADGKDE